MAPTVVSPSETPLTPPLPSRQVGVTGETEDWVLVHQRYNEPEARSLEVPGLNPYTFYRWGAMSSLARW